MAELLRHQPREGRMSAYGPGDRGREVSALPGKPNGEEGQGMAPAEEARETRETREIR
jgi:hypothetical protein